MNKCSSHHPHNWIFSDFNPPNVVCQGDEKGAAGLGGRISLGPRHLPTDAPSHQPNRILIEEGVVVQSHRALKLS